MASFQLERERCGITYFAEASANLATIPALVLNKSSLVIPYKRVYKKQDKMEITGLRGTPAGIRTTSAPSRAFPRSSPSMIIKPYFRPMRTTFISSDGRFSVDVAQISSDTWGVYDIVKRKFRNQRVHFHEQRKRLANASYQSNVSETKQFKMCKEKEREIQKSKFYVPAAPKTATL